VHVRFGTEVEAVPWGELTAASDPPRWSEQPHILDQEAAAISEELTILATREELRVAAETAAATHPSGTRDLGP
jgi:hypothetical protein